MVLTGIKTSTLHPGKVTCEYCAGCSKTPWFLAKNLQQHLKCASHLKSAGEEQVRRETKEFLDRLHAQDLERLRQSDYEYAPLSHPGQPEVPVLKKHQPKMNEQQMWDDFELDQSNASFLNVDSTDQFNPTEQREAEFYRILDRAEMSFDPTGWGFEEFDAERDVDETLTNVMQNFGQSQKSSSPKIRQGSQSNQTSTAHSQRTTLSPTLGSAILAVLRSQTNGLRIRTRP